MGTRFVLQQIFGLCLLTVCLPTPSSCNNASSDSPTTLIPLPHLKTLKLTVSIMLIGFVCFGDGLTMSVIHIGWLCRWWVFSWPDYVGLELASMGNYCCLLLHLAWLCRSPASADYVADVSPPGLTVSVWRSTMCIQIDYVTWRMFSRLNLSAGHSKRSWHLYLLFLYSSLQVF